MLLTNKEHKTKKKKKLSNQGVAIIMPFPKRRIASKIFTSSGSTVTPKPAKPKAVKKTGAGAGAGTRDALSLPPPQLPSLQVTSVPVVSLPRTVLVPSTLSFNPDAGMAVSG